MTNTRLSASAVDWLEDSSSKRSFPVVVWDGEFIKGLATRLQKGRPESSQVVAIHRLLVNRWRTHRQAEARRAWDPRLEEPFEIPRATVKADFVDREEELQELCDFSSYNVAGLVGPAGIGKTVLAHRVAKEAENCDYYVLPIRLHGKDDALKQIAIPIAKLLQAHFDDDTLIGRLRVHLWDDVSDLLEAVASRISAHPLYLLIEDVHVLAPASGTAQLFNLLQASAGASRLLLTSRLSSLWRGSLLTPDLIVSLGGFDEADIRAFFRQKKLSCPDDIVRALANRYSGWPILVSLSCNELGAEPNGAAVGAALTKGSLQSVRTLAEGLLSVLSPNARRLFACVLSLRTKLSQSDLQFVCDLSTPEYQTAWLELAARGLINPSASLVECTHDLFKDILRPALPEATQIDLSLAEYLLLFDRDADRALAASEHCLAAGEFDRAARAIISSQEVILGAGRIKPLLQVLAALEPEYLDELIYVDLVIVRIRCLEVQGRIEEGLDTLRTFIHEELGPQLPPALRARSKYWESRLLYFLGNYRDAERCLREAQSALEHIGSNDSQRGIGSLAGYILLQEGRIKYIRRDPNSARSLYNAALAIFELEEDPRGANIARHRLAMVDVLEGHVDRALRGFERVRVEAKRLRDAKREAYALHRMGQIRRLQGNWSKAELLFHESLELKNEIGHRRGLVFSRVALADVALAVGNLLDAEQELSEAEKLALELRMPKEHAQVLSAWSRLFLARGDVGQAVAFGERAASQYESMGLGRRASAIRGKLATIGNSNN